VSFNRNCSAELRFLLSANRGKAAAVLPAAWSVTGKENGMPFALKEKRAGQMLGPGSPNGRVDAEVNSVYLDTANAMVYVKEYDGKKTGWIVVGQLIPFGGSSPATGRL
jgi:hypothetical protein